MSSTTQPAREPAIALDPEWLRGEYVEEGRTLRSLERETGINRKRLARTLAGMGISARIGRPPVDGKVRALDTETRMSARVEQTWKGSIRTVALYDTEQWVVYLLIDPRADDVRYVGKTTHPDRRLAEHLSCSSDENTEKSEWVRELRSLGLSPYMQVVATGSDDSAHLVEAEWIDRCRADGADLFNKSRPIRGARITLVPVRDLVLPGLESLVLVSDATLPSNLLPKIEHDPSTGCWVWTASMSDGGYGVVQYNGSVHRAHRVVYTCLVGPIPEKHVLDHLADICGNRACVFPGHLEPITNRENILRGTSPSAGHAKKTHCPRNHPYTPENTRFIPNANKGRGARHCLTCARDADRRRYATKKTKQTEKAA